MHAVKKCLPPAVVYLLAFVLQDYRLSDTDFSINPVLYTYYNKKDLQAQHLSDRALTYSCQSVVRVTSLVFQQGSTHISIMDTVSTSIIHWAYKLERRSEMHAMLCVSVS